MRKRRIFAAAAALPLAIAGMGIAYADNINDNITDSGAGLSLVAGSSMGGTATIKVVSSSGNDGDPDCNLDGGTERLVLEFNSPAGVTVDGDPSTAEVDMLTITVCDHNYPVLVKAGAAAAAGTSLITASINTNTSGVGSFNNNVGIPITVTKPNTPPVVTVTGVADGASYVVGQVPTAGCSVVDAEDTGESATPVITGTLTNGLGSQTVTCSYRDGGGLTDSESVTYTIVPPPNTAPVVAVTGVEDGATYEIGSVPPAGCDVTDAEDVGESATPQFNNVLAHGIGSQTVSCSYTDQGGMSDSDFVTYTIVDTGDPTITHSLSPSTGPNANGWYKTNVIVDFTCDDGTGSGIQSCTGDTTLDEGENQSVTGTATDWAGNTASDTAADIDIDKTPPTGISFSGGPAATVYFGDSITAPTCSATDTLSGLDKCEVTGGGTSLGAHKFTATATDMAGNTATMDFDYTVLAWSLKGFYAPVDMGGVWNTVKGGSTVPLKFEVFAAQELTSTSAIKSFVQKTVACPGGTASVDEIEVTSTGGTSLRYDATGGQFIQNWQTPKKPGTCYTVTMTTQDDSKISANFALK